MTVISFQEKRIKNFRGVVLEHIKLISTLAQCLEEKLNSASFEEIDFELGRLCGTVNVAYSFSQAIESVSDLLIEETKA